MEEQENKGARSAQELRSDIEKGVSDVQGIKDSWADALNGGESQSGMATYGQMKELVNRQELAELQNSSKAQDAIASALAIAQQSGGRLPHAVTDYLNRQFGFDGKTIGIMDGGIDPKTGEFGFVFGERDRAGNTAMRKQMIPLSVQLGLMEGYPGLFNEDDVKAHRQKMMTPKEAGGLGLTSGEVDAYSNVARLSRERLAARMAELSPREAISPGDARKARALLSGGGQNGISPADILKDVSAMQKFMTDNAATMDDGTREQMGAALGNAMKLLSSRYLPKSANGGAQQTAAPQVSEDGSMMKLMDGRTIRKDQEFEVGGPNGQKMKLIWRGGDPKNVEKIR